MSATDDTSLFRDSKNKMIFAGKIEIRGASDVHHTPWAEVIKAAKGALPCWNVDTQSDLAGLPCLQPGKGQGSRARRISLGLHAGNGGARLLRRTARTGAYPWGQGAGSCCSDSAGTRAKLAIPRAGSAAAHRPRAYDDRVSAMQIRLGLNRFAAALSVHGEAVKNRGDQSMRPNFPENMAAISDRARKSLPSRDGFRLNGPAAGVIEPDLTRGHASDAGSRLRVQRPGQSSQVAGVYRQNEAVRTRSRQRQAGDFGPAEDCLLATMHPAFHTAAPEGKAFVRAALPRLTPSRCGGEFFQRIVTLRP